jgi:hypothetical protein
VPHSSESPATVVQRTYYLIAGVYTLSASLIWGINTMFLLESGLSLMEAFIANAVFTGAWALFEVPTGLVATRVAGGRLLSVTLLAGRGRRSSQSPTARGCQLHLASIILGLGFTFYSGAVEAWLVDALNATGYTGPVDRVLARGALISSIAQLVGAVSGGLLGGISLAIPYLVRCVLLVGAFAIAFVAMHDIGFTVRALRWSDVPREMMRIGRESVRFGWNEPHARLAMLAGAAPAIFLAWGWYAWQPYFTELLGHKAAWVLGVIAAAISLATAAGNWLVERLTRFCGHRTTILLGATIVYTTASIGVGFAPVFWAAVALYLVAMMASGVFQPVLQGYLHAVVQNEQRATVLSLASLLGSVSSMGGQAGLGWIAAHRSLGAGYAIGGFTSVLAIPWLIGMRRLNGAPDRIVGKAGRYAACEALAVPAGAQASAKREVA